MIHYYKTHLHLFAKLKAASCIKTCKIALKNASDANKASAVIQDTIPLDTVSLKASLAKRREGERDGERTAAGESIKNK